MRTCGNIKATSSAICRWMERFLAAHQIGRWSWWGAGHIPGRWSKDLPRICREAAEPVSPKELPHDHVLKIICKIKFPTTLLHENRACLDVQHIKSLVNVPETTSQFHLNVGLGSTATTAWGRGTELVNKQYTRHAHCSELFFHLFVTFACVNF